MTDPYGNPMSASPEQPLLAIGDIAVTQNRVIVPWGNFPLRGTEWYVQDFTQARQVIPTHAIVLAIVFSVLLCLLGLLFLLMKETEYSGYIAVTVHGEGFTHTAYVPPGPANAAWAMNQVNYARSIAAAAI
jgi:hypothetical protein